MRLRRKRKHPKKEQSMLGRVIDLPFEDFKKEDFIKEEDWSILKERFLKIDILTY